MISKERLQKIKFFLLECHRVLKVTKKPNRMEFKTIVKVSAIGMAIIGFIGFVISMVKHVFF